jgi:D-beta-D-heptose 7-phosphate kinase/D-beta-D-heptose 1-phosphate adenosyltransferase
MSPEVRAIAPTLDIDELLRQEMNEHRAVFEATVPALAPDSRRRTNGCFDLLHPGHIFLLEQARRSADRAMVGLNSDVSIRRIKRPQRPVQGEVARTTVLAAVESVDAVVIFPQDTPLELIEALQPDVLIKGKDYTLETVVGAAVVIARGGTVVLADLLPGHNTSTTVERKARFSGA